MRQAAVCVVMAGLCLAGGGCATVERAWAKITGHTPMDAVRKMEDTASADNRRIGINHLVSTGFGKHNPYTERYKQISQMDPDYTVRAIAIRALNRARDQSATPVFIRSLNDQAELVRLEAAKALVNLPDRNAIAPLVRIVTSTDEDRDVRIAAADALKHYRTLDVARALVDQLDDREFGIAWQSRQSLVKLTGQDMGYNTTLWLQYLSGPNKPLG